MRKVSDAAKKPAERKPAVKHKPVSRLLIMRTNCCDFILFFSFLLRHSWLFICCSCLKKKKKKSWRVWHVGGFFHPCVQVCVFLHHRLLATSEPQCHMLLRPLSQQPPREEWVKWRKRGKNKRYSWEPSITWTYYEISLPFSLHIYSNMKVSSYQHFLFSSLS